MSFIICLTNKLFFHVLLLKILSNKKKYCNRSSLILSDYHNISQKNGVIFLTPKLTPKLTPLKYYKKGTLSVMIKKTIKEIGNSTVLTLTKDVTMGKKVKKGSECIVSSKLKKDHIVVTAKIYFDLSDEKIE